MIAILQSVALAAGLFCSGEGNSVGFLVPAKTDKVKATPAREKAPQPRPYQPKEGDLIFFDDHSLFWNALFYWAGSGPPLHMGMVVKKADGTLAVLEAGPDDSVKVYIQDVEPRLRKFQETYKGTITIRRCKKDLTREQSEALSKFAKAQEGKRYAVLRLLLQGTSFRTRGFIREMFLAETHLDRSSWICSELSVAAGTVAGLFPDSVKSNVTYPRDLVDNRRHDLSRIWHDPEIWRPELSEAKKGANSR